MTSFTGLGNLASIEGALLIDNNDALTNLTELENLNSIGDYLWIFENNALYSLAGIDNINASSISNLAIANNSSLTTCEVVSICDYLSAPNGYIEIHDNAPGCNYPEEVMEACDTTTRIQEFNSQNTFTISPNPLISNTVIEYTLKHNSQVLIQILDLSGREVITLVKDFQQMGKHNVVFQWNRIAKKGIYFCVFKNQ